MHVIPSLLLVSAIFLVSCSLIYASPPFEDFTEFGVSGVGFNRDGGGQPIFRFDNLQFLVSEHNFPPFVLFAGFNTSGAFDAGVGEGGGNSTSITPSTSSNAKLTTHYDALGMSFLGVIPPADSRLNIPLDNNFIRSDDFGIGHSRVPCATETSDPTKITRAAPCTEDITLGKWLEANVVITVRCWNDPTVVPQAKLTAVYTDLIPDRMYSHWFVFEAFPQVIKATPLGGVPNVFVTDKNGYYLTQRDLGFCPFRQGNALAFAAHLRSDGQNYGGVPVPFLNPIGPEPFSGYDAKYPGSAVNIQLTTNINGTVLNPNAKRDIIRKNPSLRKSIETISKLIPDWQFEHKISAQGN